jgi:hypothetical protein
MPALTLGGMGLTNTEPGVHDSGLFDNETICMELPDVLARVCVGDFGGFVGVEPDFTFAAAKDFGGKGLLGAQVRHLG